LPYSNVHDARIVARAITAAKHRALAMAARPRGPVCRSRPTRKLHVASDAEALTADALDSVDAAGKQPFFITVFYSTTHFPYAAPSPFYKRFVKPGYRGKYRYAKADTLVAENSFKRRGCRTGARPLRRSGCSSRYCGWTIP